MSHDNYNAVATETTPPRGIRCQVRAGSGRTEPTLPELRADRVSVRRAAAAAAKRATSSSMIYVVLGQLTPTPDRQTEGADMRGHDGRTNAFRIDRRLMYE